MKHLHFFFQKRFWRISSAVLFCFQIVVGSLFAVPVFAASPVNIISYQGRLLNSNRVPLSSATASVVFELYTASSGGSCVWSNSSSTCASATARTVTLTDGLFSENLGDTAASPAYAAISDSIFGNNASLYLQVTVNSETLSPRKYISAAPYALNAQMLDGMDSDNDGATAAALVAYNSSGNLVVTGNPSGSGVGNGSVYINPASGDVSANDVLLGIATSGSSQFTVDGEGDVSANGDIAISGGDITTSATTFNVLTANATTVNLATAATTLSLGAGTGTTTVNNALTVSGTLSANGAVTLGDNGDTVAVDSSDWDISSSGDMTGIGSIAADGNFTITKADPSFIFNVSTASDTDFWMGVQDDAGGTDNDLFQIGDGTSPGTNPFFTVNTSGNVGIGDVSPAALLSVGSGDLFQVSSAGTLLFNGVTTDVTTGTDQALTFSPNGTGDAIFTVDADSRVQLSLSGLAGTMTNFSLAYPSSATLGAGAIITGAEIDLLTNVTADGGGNTLTGLSISIGNGGAGISTGLALNGAMDRGILTAGVTTDFLSGTNQDLTLLAQGTGDVVLQSNSVTLLTLNDSGNVLLDPSGASSYVSVASADDFIVGGTSLTASPFSVDTATQTINFGSGSTSDPTLTFRASDGATTGQIAYDTSDTFYITGSNIYHQGLGALPTISGSTASYFTSGDSISGTSGNDLQALKMYGGLFSLSYSAVEGSGTTSHEVEPLLGSLSLTGSSTTITRAVGVKGAVFNSATTASVLESGGYFAGTVGLFTQVASATVADGQGLHGEVVATGGTITNGVGVYGTLVAGSGSITNSYALYGSNTSVGSTRYGLYTTVLGTTAYAGYLVQDSVNDATTTPTGQALVLDVNEAANNDEVILVRSDADGTPDTEFRFENDGDAFADGAWNGSGADFAEFFPSTDRTIGDYEIVCWNALQASGVKRCAAGETDVVGVISTNAAFIGNSYSGAEASLEDNPNYALVGLVGQIETHVSAEAGAIAVGDPITTSLVRAGYGAKATGGTYIIGRALEPLPSGTGTIKVLVQPMWYGGDMLSSDGEAASFGGGIALGGVDATSGETAVDSAGLSFVGSYWNGSAATDVSLALRNDVLSQGSSRLSLQNNDGMDVMTFGSTGDLAIAGNFYPSDHGALQYGAYVYYDRSGPGYMKTNASGWATNTSGFSENFASVDALVPGDVVEFADQSSVVRSSGETYSDRVAGVVSLGSAFVGGSDSGAYSVTLSGRVSVKVTAENGAITPGDALTTSSLPGYAMKATQSGQVLGYALASWEAGEGSISMLVRPQYVSFPTNGSPSLAMGSQDVETLNVSGVLSMNGGTIVSVGTLSGIGTWEIRENGDIVTQGQLTQVVRSLQNEDVSTYAVTSPETVVQLAGTSTLHHGVARVTFENVDPEFNDIISPEHDFRVLVTPNDVTGQLYVTDRSNEGFIIRDVQASEGVSVDWLVLAYRYDLVPESANEVPEILVESEDLEEESTLLGGDDEPGNEEEGVPEEDVPAEGNDQEILSEPEEETVSEEGSGGEEVHDSQEDSQPSLPEETPPSDASVENAP